jgi:ribosome-associated protein
MLGLKRTNLAALEKKLPHLSPEEIAILAIGAGIERKAFAPVLLDLRGQNAFTDYFAILSASNSRQVAAVAEGIKRYCRENLGLRPTSVDGMETLNWVLLDFGFLFIHVFQSETRAVYQLEEMWSKASVVPVDEASYIALREREGL